MEPREKLQGVKKSLGHMSYALKKETVMSLWSKQIVFGSEAQIKVAAQRTGDMGQKNQDPVVMQRYIEIHEGGHPVFCKIEVDPATIIPDAGDKNNSYDLIFHVQLIRKDELGKDLYECCNVVPDLLVFLSTSKREPTESNCEKRVYNKYKFAYKCALSKFPPPMEYVYFTMKSQMGCRIRVNVQLGGQEIDSKNKNKQQKSSRYDFRQVVRHMKHARHLTSRYYQPQKKDTLKHFYKQEFSKWDE